MDISKTLTRIAATLLEQGEAWDSEDLESCRDQIEAERNEIEASRDEQSGHEHPPTPEDEFTCQPKSDNLGHWRSVDADGGWIRSDGRTARLTMGLWRDQLREIDKHNPLLVETGVQAFDPQSADAATDAILELEARITRVESRLSDRIGSLADRVDRSGVIREVIIGDLLRVMSHLGLVDSSESGKVEG